MVERQMRLGISVFLASLTLTICSTAVVATAVPLGAEFQINTYSSSEQYLPSVSLAADGNFVVVWSDYARLGIFGQRYDGSGGATGSEFVVSAPGDIGSLAFGSAPAVLWLDSGDFVVAYRAPGLSGIAVRRFDSMANPVGVLSNIVTQRAASGTGLPGVAAADDGGFVIVWDDVQQPGVGASERDIFGQRFDSTGVAVGTTFQINSYTTGYQRDPVIVSGWGDGFVVVWTGSTSSSYLPVAVFARRFDSIGGPRGTEFRVSAYTSTNQSEPSVSADSSGRFVVVWADVYRSGYSGRDGEDSAVFGRRFDNLGMPLGAEFQVNTWTSSGQARAQVASADDGRFVVLWASNGQASDQSGGYFFSQRDIYAQLYSASGSRVGTEFLANTYTPLSDDPSVLLDVASTADGKFVVVWDGEFREDGSSDNVFGRRFSMPSGSTTTTMPPPAAGTCGDPVNQQQPLQPDAVNTPGVVRAVTATDALFVLQAAVGSQMCAPCVCDVNNVAGITSTDALIVLQVSVGQPVVLSCPAC